jgi:purine-binding chemotaxis protein CheW
MKQFTTFRIEEEIFAIDVNSIQEIISIPKFTKIPRSKDFIIGMFSLRGHIITNFCLKTLFNITNKCEEDHCIILKTQTDPISVSVNEVLDIIDIDPDSIEPCPEVTGLEVRNYFQGIVKISDRVITILNVDEIKY